MFVRFLITLYCEGHAGWPSTAIPASAPRNLTGAAACAAGAAGAAGAAVAVAAAATPLASWARLRWWGCCHGGGVAASFGGAAASFGGFGGAAPASPPRSRSLG